MLLLAPYSSGIYNTKTIPLEENVNLTHWLQELLAKNTFLDILEIFCLDLSQISSNLLTKDIPFLSTSTAFIGHSEVQQGPGASFKF